jgi:nucleoside-diphosphate-sugar epimerase
LVSNFITRALLDRDLTVYGDGTQTRSFCYVDDLIDALVKLMATPDRVTGPINIGNPSECSMVELAALIIELTGSRSRTVNRPLPENDPRQRRPDISRARTVGLGAAHSAEGWIDPDDFLLRKTVERERGACSLDRQRSRLIADISARQNDFVAK